MDNYKNNPALFESKAEIIKAIAHPVRLCIVKNLVQNGPRNVTQMQACIDAPQSTVSQHLARLKAARVIKGERRGLEVIYTIANKEVMEIIKILFD